MFHNIFKKKIQVANKPKLKIIADIHEKDSMIPAELKSNQEIELTMQNLEIGDYLINNTVIERKTINDLISSIISKRILSQINNMCAYEKKLLIIEGDLNKNIKVNPKIIRGFILSCSLNHNLPVIQTKDYRETSEFLVLLAKQQLKPDYQSSLHSRIPKTIEEQKQYILEAFPNIGPKKAEKLLEKFKTLEKIFNLNEDELKDILKNQAKEFKKIINS